MYNLSDEQSEGLVEVVISDFGINLGYSEFAEVVLEFFEDIPGFESIPVAKARSIVHQLWRTYHGKNVGQAG